VKTTTKAAASASSDPAAQRTLPSSPPLTSFFRRDEWWPERAIVRLAVASAAVQFGTGVEYGDRPLLYTSLLLLLLLLSSPCAHTSGATETDRSSGDAGASEKNPCGGLVDIESRPKNRCPNTVPYPAERLRWIRPIRSGVKWEGVRCFRAAVSIGGGSPPRPAGLSSDSAATVDDGFAS